MTKVITLPIAQLIGADWNYKEKGSPEKMKKLKASILRDDSVGVLPVRELASKKYEVVDGNHRLQAIQELGWKEVTCENFGKISRVEAVLLAKRRNAEWFEDDHAALTKLMGEVMKEIKLEDLATFMPESLEELESYKHLASLNWQDPGKRAVAADPDHHILTVKLSTKTFKAFEIQVQRVKRMLTTEAEEEPALEQVYAAIATVLKETKDITFKGA